MDSSSLLLIRLMRQRALPYIILGESMFNETRLIRINQIWDNIFHSFLPILLQIVYSQINPQIEEVL